MLLLHFAKEKTRTCYYQNIAVLVAVRLCFKYFGCGTISNSNQNHFTSRCFGDFI